MIKNALEVLNICSVLPKVQLILCEPTPKIQDTQNDLLEEEIYDEDENDNVGLNIIIKAAEGDLLDADIQKAALSVIITCVCAPIHRVCNFNFIIFYFICIYYNHIKGCSYSVRKSVDYKDQVRHRKRYRRLELVTVCVVHQTTECC